MSNGWMTFWYCVAGSPPFSRPGVRPQLVRGRGDLELVAEVPDADLLAGELAGVVDAAVLPGHRQGAGALEDLGDVDQVGARLAGLEDLGHPRDRELGAVGRRADLLRDDRRAAGEHLDRQVLGREVALLVRREVAGELGLRRPLELQADRSAASAAGPRRRRRCAGATRPRAAADAGAGRRRGRRSRSRRSNTPRAAIAAATSPRMRVLLPHASPLCRRPARRGALSSAAAREPRIGGTIPNPGRRTIRRSGSRLRIGRQPSLRDRACHGITSRSTSAISR